MKLRKPSATAPRVRPVERRESISSAIAERFAEWALANQTHDYIPRMTRQNLDIMYEQRVEQLVESPLSDPDALDNLKLTLREMRVGGFAPTKSSASEIIKAFVKAEEVEGLWEFLEYLNELGWKITTKDTESIIRMLWNQDSVINVADLHERLTRRKPLTKQHADISLAIYVRIADFHAAEKILLRMKTSKFRADAVTYLAMTGSKYDPRKPGAPSTSITAIMNVLRGKQNASAAKATDTGRVTIAPPTDKTRRVLRNVLQSLTTTEGEFSSNPDKASDEYVSALRQWQRKNLNHIKHTLQLRHPDSEEAELDELDEDDDDFDDEKPDFGKDRKRTSYFLRLEEPTSELDGLLTLAFIAPRFWRAGTSAATRASTIRHALGIVDVDYNRLEWLGDSVLELLVREHLMRMRPGSDEGQLTQIASSIVSTQGCDAMLRCLRLDRFILQGNSTLKDQEVEKINADVLEALLGALMIGAGFAETQRIFQSTLLPAVTGEAQRLLTNFPIERSPRRTAAQRKRN